MWAFLGVICFIATVVFVIMGVVSKVNKKPNAKRNFILAGVAFVVFIAAMAANPSAKKEPLAGQESSTPAVTESATPSAEATANDEAKKKADDEAKAKEAADAKAKAEEEAKAKAEEAAKKEKSFNGDGTFAVNEEVKPGIYKSEGGVTYWARLKGFSGELGDILANGTPAGSAIVEIKSTDKGFQTMGSGSWVKIDDTYKPEKLKEFGDGSYIVGVDIEPGTYKSDSSVTYWARVKSFTGELSSILANGTPTGPEIVQIKATDKGFETSGGGTWKKIK